LRIFQGVEFERLLILDCNPKYYAFNIKNYVPITTYNGGRDDNELAKLTDYLVELASKNELASDNSSYFGYDLMLNAKSIAQAFEYVFNR